MPNKKLIKKEISAIHWLFMITGKLLIGIGIGVLIATHYWHAQPYWFLMILVGAAILIPTLLSIMKIEEKEELKLSKELRK